jgi:G:T/U-mismatch repair DNA glycosylase
VSVLPDVLRLNLKIVFCGTAVGAASARRQAYYGGQGNAFWPTLHKVGLTPRLFAPEEFRDLLGLQMGLTDLVKTTTGNDSILSKDGCDRARLRKVISAYRPKITQHAGQAEIIACSRSERRIYRKRRKCPSQHGLTNCCNGKSGCCVFWSVCNHRFTNGPCGFFDAFRTDHQL